MKLNGTELTKVKEFIFNEIELDLFKLEEEMGKSFPKIDTDKVNILNISLVINSLENESDYYSMTGEEYLKIVPYVHYLVQYVEN